MDEASAKKLLHELVSSTIPEYIIEGSQYLLDSGGVQKISVKKGDGYWDISGTVQGEDFQIYSPKISLDFHENSTNFICNCPEAFSGACRHVGAAALKFIPSLEEDNATEAAPAKPRSDWRQNFRSSLQPSSNQRPVDTTFFTVFTPNRADCRFRSSVRDRTNPDCPQYIMKLPSSKFSIIRTGMNRFPVLQNCWSRLVNTTTISDIV